MEKELYDSYKELRKKGLKLKKWWFMHKAKTILKEIDPEANFQFSDDWFTGFKKRHGISLRRATNTSQKEPDNKRSAIQHFHRSIREKAKKGTSVGSLGKWTKRQIANVDQTPLPFTFTEGSTYADKGEKSVWVVGGASGLDKRQCTAQLTVFADGEPRVKPMLIFRGTGKRISLAERTRYDIIHNSGVHVKGVCACPILYVWRVKFGFYYRYDRRVTVQFQPKAWCDESVMKAWIAFNWKPACSGPMHLIADVHRAQTTENILNKLEKDCNTDITFVPGGCTSLIQPLDVVVNKPFKDRINQLASQHMQENLDSYVKGKISAKERRILFTQWVGQAWEEVSSNEEMVKRSFIKTGIAVAIDGSEDKEINIRGLDNYQVESDEDDSDPFSDSEDDIEDESDPISESEDDDGVSSEDDYTSED